MRTRTGRDETSLLTGRRKVLSESNETEYKAIIKKTWPNIECVYQQYKSMMAKFPISNF